MEPQFYTLPARELQVGMSTDDGQDILAVTTTGMAVSATVYTPRPDDLAQDETNQLMPETRVYQANQPVDLAVFEDTEIDGSTR